jgi:proteasome lid subunit RPN8/RPN11
MRIQRSVLETIAAHGERGYPYEVCGALFSRRGKAIVFAVALANQETGRPRERYRIDPRELDQLQRAAHRDGFQIAGFWHTHPDAPGRPSEADRRAAAAGLSDGVVHLVVSIERGQCAQVETAWIFRDELQAFVPEALELD